MLYNDFFIVPLRQNKRLNFVVWKMKIKKLL
jgi:hypothetical protein